MGAITKEHIQELWAKFDKIKDEAEQYMFPELMFWDLKLTPLYKDLMENWDDDHARIFSDAMTKVLVQRYGVKIDGYSV